MRGEIRPVLGRVWPQARHPKDEPGFLVCLANSGNRKRLRRRFRSVLIQPLADTLVGPVFQWNIEIKRIYPTARKHKFIRHKDCPAPALPHQDRWRTSRIAHKNDRRRVANWDVISHVWQASKLRTREVVLPIATLQLRLSVGAISKAKERRSLQ